MQLRCIEDGNRQVALFEKEREFSRDGSVTIPVVARTRKADKRGTVAPTVFAPVTLTLTHDGKQQRRVLALQDPEIVVLE